MLYKFVILKSILILLSHTSLPFCDAQKIIDVTKFSSFTDTISQRDDRPYAVLYIANSNSSTIPAFWKKAASKVVDVIGMAVIYCNQILIQNKESEVGFAQAYCSDAKSKKKGSTSYSIQGYTFNEQSGAHMSSTITFKWNQKASAEPSITKLSKWLTSEMVSSSGSKNGKAKTQQPSLLTNLVIPLSSQSQPGNGVSIFHKETISTFLQYKAGTVTKVIFFSTSPKVSDPIPVLMKSLALRYRQRLLLGEVKASDTTMRKVLNVESIPSMVIVSAGSNKRQVIKLQKKNMREQIQKKLDGVVKDSDKEEHLHLDLYSKTEELRGQTQHVKVKKQSYSNAESENKNFPKGFNPWKIMGFKKEEKNIPNKDTLKQTYRAISKKWHPDRCKLNKKKCETNMANTGLANDVLSDQMRLQQWEAWNVDTSGGRKRREEL